MRINYIHEQITIAKTIKLVWINSENQVADIMTKPLKISLHEPLADILLTGHKGIPPSPIPPVIPSLKSQYKNARKSAENARKNARKNAQKYRKRSSIENNIINNK